MDITIAIATLAILSLLSFSMGRRRAVAAAAGIPRTLHSRPNH